MVANYATQPFAAAAITCMPGSRKDTITPAGDVATIALWPGDFTTTVPVAGVTVSGVLAAYLAAYPGGPQIS
jgi:hypothetical protein